ncbi:glycosyltransferase family 87 protein [Sinomonas susongensis]|uniref:glycosyltransferase family 87 protein n=1 Tax=Sinomonas susongensis TaxID=1324851 RepID=UPI00110840BB|nr:glycosyltransferase family 87 protein [Sinomonas susongensis]
MVPSNGAQQGTQAPVESAGSIFAARYPLVVRAAAILIWPLSLMAIFVSVRHFVLGGQIGQDSHAYWLAARGSVLYQASPGERDAYLCSPAFALLVKPLALLPWPAFQAAWFALESAAAWWLVRPLRLRWALPVLLLCLPELIVSNIYILLAVSAVVGLRRPAAWSFPILTKVAPGVGLLWFAGRGEWRRLLEGVAFTAVIVGISYALEPQAWQGWVEFLVYNRNGTPDSSLSFFMRSCVALALVFYGARKRWPFLIAPAMILASPVLTPVIPFTILVAVPRLLLIEVPRCGSRPAAATP